METQITNYTFDASEKKITFSDYPVDGIKLNRVLLVVNTTTGHVLYGMANPTGNAPLRAGVSGNVLTLEYDTTSMNDSDSLYIAYYDPDKLMKIIDGALKAGENLQQKVQGITDKPVSEQQYTSSIYAPATTNVSKDFIKASSGTLRLFYLSSVHQSVLRYLLFFNKTSAPSNGDVPILGLRFPIPPAPDATHPTELKQGADIFDKNGDWFTSGIAYGISTTRDTYTDAGSGTDYVIRGKYS